MYSNIPIPNGLGGTATLINIDVSNGDLICHRTIIPAAPKWGVVGIMSPVSIPALLSDLCIII